MIRLISSDGMNDINYAEYALEVNEDEEGFWLINAYANLEAADYGVSYYTMSVNDTKEEALEELANVRAIIGTRAKETNIFVQLEDHISGPYYNRNGE